MLQLELSRHKVVSQCCLLITAIAICSIIVSISRGHNPVLNMTVHHIEKTDDDATSFQERFKIILGADIEAGWESNKESNTEAPKDFYDYKQYDVTKLTEPFNEEDNQNGNIGHVKRFKRSVFNELPFNKVKTFFKDDTVNENMKKSSTSPGERDFLAYLNSDYHKNNMCGKTEEENVSLTPVIIATAVSASLCLVAILPFLVYLLIKVKKYEKNIKSRKTRHQEEGKEEYPALGKSDRVQSEECEPFPLNPGPEPDSAYYEAIPLISFEENKVIKPLKISKKIPILVHFNGTAKVRITEKRNKGRKEDDMEFV